MIRFFCRLFRISETAANEVPASGTSSEFAIGVNERPMVENEDWQLVTPWGEFRHAMGLQRVTRAQGDAMVAAFNSLGGRLGRAFRGLPIFAGHPDVHPDKYPDKRRYGKIEALEAREDGLYCKPAWNTLGQENQQQGFYLYPSPVWSFRRCGNGVIEPTRLLSIGLTNMPNIQESKPWSENERPPTPEPNLTALMRYRSNTRNQTKGTP